MVLIIAGMILILADIVVFFTIGSQWDNVLSVIIGGIAGFAGIFLVITGYRNLSKNR